MPFNLMQTRSPEDLIDEGIAFAKEMYGGSHAPLLINRAPYTPPSGSHAPSGLSVITVSKNAQTLSQGNYFKFIMGFHGEKPFIYEKETYQETSPGYLPINANEKLGSPYYRFGRAQTTTSVLNPLQHIFALAGGTVLGVPGGMDDLDEMERTRYDKLWQTARSFGVETTDSEGRAVKIGGIPLSLKGAESSARERIDAMGAGPVIGLQNIPKNVPNIEATMERAARADASSGKIPGLPRDRYGLDTISSTHRLTTAETIGVPMASGGYSSLTNTITKAAQIGKRPYAPMMAFGRNRAFDVPEDPAWRTETAVFGEGDPVGKQLVLSGMIPTIGGEGSRGSGMSHFQAPKSLLSKIRGSDKGAMLEATFRSIIDVPIEVKRPEDMFYQTESGEQKLRLVLANEWTPTALEKKNVIQAGSTFRIADLIGVERGNVNRKALVATTQQRHVAVEGAMATLPLEWLDNPDTKTFTENTLIPALREQGIGQFEYRATPQNRYGARQLTIGLNVRQGEPMSLKNYTKVTNSPLPRGMMGLWRKGEDGNLRLESQTDSVIPFKSPEGAIWSAFRIADRAQQKNMLYSLGLSMEQKKALKGYYSGLQENQPTSINSIAQVLGMESGVHVLEAMRYSILGTKNIVQKIDKSGRIIIDQAVAKQQQLAYEKYGISRDYGFLPIGEFTETTRDQFVEGAVRNLLKHTPYKMTEQEARTLVGSAYSFAPGEKLASGKQIYQGYEIQEVIRAKELALNPEIETGGTAREVYGSIDNLMAAAGRGDIVKFRNMTKRETGATYRALDELATTFSSTLQNAGAPGRYIHVGDDPTDVSARRMNRSDFMSLLTSIEISEGSSSGILTKLQSEMSNLFGEGNYGFEFGLGNKKAYLPSISAVQRIDADTLTVEPGEETEVKNRSLARIPERFISTARSLSSGDEIDFEQGINQIRRTANTYVGSDNLRKKPYGIYSAYEGNTLLEPGQLYVSNPGLRRMYQISGGDIRNVSELKEYFNAFMGGAVGFAERHPIIGQIAGNGRYASVAPYQILTQQNSEIGRKIAIQEKAAGIRGQDIVSSPDQASVLGDYDADKFGLYVAIGRALGDTKGFISALGGKTAEEKFAYTKQLLAEQAPEVQEQAMEYMMQGSDLALKKSPTMLNRMNYLWQLSGRAPNSSLWAKSPYHNVETQYPDKVENASFQKNFAMGGTHNQLIRRIMSAGIALNAEPKTYYTAMTGIGTKFSQLAVDQEYVPQTLVKVLQGAFLKNDNGSLTISFDKSKAINGDPIFANGLPWSDKNPFIKSMSAIGAAIMGTDDLSARAMAQLFAPIRGARSARLSQEESDSLADRQLQSWEDLIPEFEAMQKMGIADRTRRMNQLASEGKISEDSIFGVSLKSRLAEHYQGHRSSKNQVRNDKATKIEQAAGRSHIDLNKELFNDKISTAMNLFEIFKGEKNLDYLAQWHDPAVFSEMAYGWAKRGLQNNPTVQAIMADIGSQHGLAFTPNASGMGVNLVSTNTNQIISSKKELVSYQNTIRSSQKQYDEYDASSDPRVQSTGQTQPTESMADNLTNLAIASGAMGAGASGSNVPPSAGGPSGGGNVPPQSPTGASPSYSYGYGGSGGGGGGGGGSSRFSASKEVSSAMAHWNAQTFRQGLDDFLYKGQKGTIEAFGTTPEQVALFGETAGLTAYERVREIQKYGTSAAQSRLPYYMRHNPKMSGAVGALRALKANAYDAWNEFGLSDEVGMLAGTMINAPGAEEALLSSEWGREMYALLPFAETPFAKERRPDLPEDKALWLRANKEFLEKSIAEQEYIKYGGAERKYAVTSRERKQALTKEDTAMFKLRELEIAKQIPASMRVTGAYAMQRGLGLSESWLKDEVTKRKEMLGDKFKIHQEEFAGPIEALETSHDTRAKIDSELGSLRGISDRANESASEVAVRESVKLASALSDVTTKSKEYLKTLGKSDEELNKLIKSYEKGTASIEDSRKSAEATRDIHAQGVRDILKAQGIQTQSGGLLSEAEITAGAKTEAGREQLQQYEKSRKESAVLQAQEEQAKGGFGERATHFLRKTLGGFGLMYVRSMANIIMGSGDTGYQESLTYESSIRKALGYQEGALEGYNPEADLFGYKALMAGGGRRLVNQAKTSLYKNNPGLVDFGNALFSGAGGAAASMWGLEAMGASAGVFGPVGLAIGALVGGTTWAMNQWGREQDSTSWLAKNWEKETQRYGFIQYGTEFQIYQKEPTFGREFAKVTAEMADAFGIAPKYVQSVEENRWLEEVKDRAQELVDSGKAANIDEALRAINASDKDILNIEQAGILQVMAEKMPGISTEGRIAAAQQLKYYDLAVNGSAGELLMNKVGRAYDVGIDYATITDKLLSATGMLASDQKGAIFSSVANLGISGQTAKRMQSVSEYASQFGPRFAQQLYGETEEEIKANLMSVRGMPSILEKDVDSIYSAITGENADIVTQFLSNQSLAYDFGLKFQGREEWDIDKGILGKLSPEEREKYSVDYSRYGTGLGLLKGWAQKSGRSTMALGKYWDQLYNTGTLSQQQQYLNLLESPSPIQFGAYVTQMAPDQAALWNQTKLSTIGGMVPQSALAFTGVDQNTGKVTGRPWGQASIALPGQSAQAVAGQIWGNWQTAGGSAQGAVNAMVNGMTVGGQTYYGQQGMQAWQNQFSYNQAMAQIGVQLKGIALSEAFTTGKGLSAYGFAEGAGFWSIEDRQRELSRQQQEASFQNQEWGMRQQEKRLALSEKYYGQNLALQQTQRTMQRSWTQQDWSYQQNVRDLQWGWKQEDFQENVRFMTGRDRRLAERQMKRDTIMHDMEGDQIERQKDRQQELWKLEDTRFSIDKKQHEESVKMQREEMAHDKQMFEQSKRFYAEEKKLQDESTRLQRAYYMEQNKLQRESAGIQAHAAKVQKDLNDAMLAYNDYADKQKGLLELATQSMQTLQTAIENLTRAMQGALEPTTYTAAQTAHHTEMTINSNLKLDGQVLANATAQQITYNWK